jgi:tetratricopeptide (TPR) repeat protein
MSRVGIFAPMLAAAVIAAPTVGIVARAQPRENPIERARHHMEMGQEAFAEGDYELATERFVDAYSASPFPAFLYNAALAREKIGDNAEAVNLYRRYLEEEPQASDAAQVQLKIRSLLAEAPTETAPGESAPGVPDVEITEVEMKSLISVRTNPADARIRILDEEGGEVSSFEGPSAQTVVRGTYTLEASHPDFRTVQTRVSVTPGQVYIVVVEMSQGAFLGFLGIKTDIPGADVYIDDKGEGSVGTTPWGNVLPAGEHRVWVEKPGYKPVEKVIEIRLGDKQKLDLQLERLEHGALLVKTNVPGARVYLDEQLLGPAPIEEQAPPGRHRLRVSADGMKDYETEVRIGKGQTTKVLVRLNPQPSRTSAWVSLGFSLALFIGGGVTGGFALEINNQLDHERNTGRLADDDPRILKGFLLGLGADIAFGLGTIVGALSIYYFVRDPLPPSEGKLFDPVDFEKNPDGAAAGPAEPGDDEPESTPPEETASRAPRLLVAPLITNESAGLGLAVVF